MPSEQRLRVSVARGVVGVEDFSSRDRADLTVRPNAASAGGNHGGMSVGVPTNPDVRKGHKRSPNVAALGRPKLIDIHNERPQKSKGLFSTNNNGSGNGGSNGNPRRFISLVPLRHRVLENL